jgi:cytochrome c biogenesis factor
MLKGLLHLHNLIWWIILISGLWANFRVWRGHLAETPWTRRERLAGLIFSSALATQLLVGLVLYFNSPIVKSLMTGQADGPERLKAAFFGVMHPLAMFTSVVLGQVGFSVSKRLGDDRRKYQVAAMCYTAALVVLLIAVPWPFLSYGRSLMP